MYTYELLEGNYLSHHINVILFDLLGTVGVCFGFCVPLTLHFFKTVRSLNVFFLFFSLHAIGFVITLQPRTSKA